VVTQRFFLLFFSVLNLWQSGFSQSFTLVAQNEKYSTDPTINFVFIHGSNTRIKVDLSIARFSTTPPNPEFYGFNAANPIPADWVLEIRPGDNYDIIDHKTIKHTGAANQTLIVKARVKDSQGVVISGLSNIDLRYRIVGNFTLSSSFTNACTGEYLVSVNEHTFSNNIISRPYTVEVFADGNLVSGFPQVVDGLGANIISLGGLDTSPPNYQFVVTNVMGQVVKGPFAIFEAYYPQANVTFAGYECFNSPSGKIDIEVEGAALPLKWRLTSAVGGEIASSESGNDFETYGVSVVIPNIGSGDYIFSFIDNNGCDGSVPLTISKPLEMKMDLLDSNPVTCPAGNDGYLIFSASGGWTQPFEGNFFNPVNWGHTYQYELIKDGQPLQNVSVTTYRGVDEETSQNSWNAYFDNLEAGSYTLKVSEYVATNDLGAEDIAYACSRTFGPFVIAQPEEFLVNLTQTDVLCHGESSGELAIAPTGGTPGYAITWYSGNFIDLGNPAGLTEILKQESIAAGAMSRLGGLAIGPYAVLAEDANGCIYASNFEIAQPDELLVGTDEVIDVNCFRESTGRIKVSLTSKSVGPYVYTLVHSSMEGNPITSSPVTDDVEYVFSDLPAGDYQVKVTDANNCQAASDKVWTINQPEKALELLILDKDDIGCFGAENGEIILSVTGGGGPQNLDGYIFDWLRNGTPYVLTGASVDTHAKNLSPGNYQVIVTDAVGCTVTSEIIQLEAPAPLELTPEIVPVSCFEGQDGVINLAVSGGVGAYTFTWNAAENGEIPAGMENAQNLSGLRAGAYAVRITDSNGCELMDNFLVTEPNQLLASVSEQVNVRCFGEATGEITIRIDQESVGGYIATLTGIDAIGQPEFVTSALTSSHTFTGLVAGTYEIGIEDINGCHFLIKPIIVTQPDARLVAEEGEVSLFGENNISCFGSSDGWITPSIQGGQGEYHVRWTGPAGFTATTASISGLAEGEYFLEVTDENGCTTSIAYTLEQPDELEVSGVPSDYNGFGISRQGASDGRIILSVAGGTAPFQYSWNTADGQIPAGMENQSKLTGLVTGTYFVVVLDAMGCGSTMEWTLLQPEELHLEEPVMYNIDCYGESSGRVLISIATASVPPFLYIISGTTYENNPYYQEISSPNISLEFQGLQAGEYNVTVRDVNGVEETLENLSLIQPSSKMAFIDEEVKSITCFGGNDGGIRIEVAGGGGLQNSPEYTYTWYKDSEVFSLRDGDAPTELWNLSPGDYQVVVGDGSGCTLTSGDYVISQPDELRVTGLMSDFSTFGISCFGADDGSITLSLTGGTGAYTYRWTTTDGQLLEAQKVQKDLTGLSAGTYTVDVVDEKGCTQSASFTLNQPNRLALNAPVVVDVACKGEATGSFMAGMAQESVGPYTYTLMSNGTTISSITTADLSFNFEGLTAGTYKVLVEGRNGCALETSELEIIEPAEKLQFLIQENTDLFCIGEAKGTISVEVTGGGGPDNSKNYSFTWYSDNQPYTLNATSTTTALRDLGPGEYYVLVDDGFGCMIRSNNFTILQPAPMQVSETLSSYNGNEISCHGGNDGSIALALTGGYGEVAYSWSTQDGKIPTGQENNRDLTGLTAGTYTVLITDQNDCQLSTTFTLREPEALLLREDISQRQDIGCYGSAEGSIVVVGTGGSSPYRFAVAGETFEGNSYSFTSDFIPQNIFSFEGLKAGDYRVELQDQNGCSIFLDGVVTISQPATPLSIINEQVSDYNGLSISCFGKNDPFIHLEVGGGSGPYSYTWTGPNGFTSTSLNLDNIAPGKYTFTLRDKMGCEVISDFDLAGPNPIEVETLHQNMLCGGEKNGNIFIVGVKGGTGNYQFVWMEEGRGIISRTLQPTNLRNIGPGRYILIVTDENSCEVIKTFTISEPEPVIVQVTSKSDNACFEQNNGTVDVSVSGGTGPYTYSWTGPEGFASTSKNLKDLYAGEYLLQVTDALQCIKALNVTINEPERIQILETISPITCFGEQNGQIFLDVSGGVGVYRYKWTGPNGFTSSSKNIHDLYAGEYTLQITDEINCTVERKFALVEPGELKVNPVISDFNGFEISCKGGSNGFIDLQISGGTGDFTVIWEGPKGFHSEAEKIEGLYPGEYEVFIKDERDCWFRDTFLLKEPDQLVIGEENLTPKMVSCFNGRDGSILVNLYNQSVGPYHYEIKGQYLNGVFHEEAIQTSALFYEFSGLRAGSYRVAVTDANGCHITEVSGVEISQPQTELEAEVAVKDVLCYLANNGSVAVQAKGGTPPYAILWNNGSESWMLENLAPGRYTATVTDKNGCEVNVMADVKEAPEYTVNPEVSNITCKGLTDGFIKLNIMGGISPVKVKWDHGPQTPELFNLSSGVYSATITDASLCAIRREFVIIEPEQLQITSSLTHALECDNPASGSIQVNPFGGTPPFTYQWSNGSTQSLAQNLTPGQYSVRVTDESGCSQLAQFTIHRPEPLRAAVIQYPLKVCEPRTMQTAFETVVSGGQPPYQISWNSGMLSNGGATMVTEGEGLFTLTVTDQMGCRYVETFSVVAEDDILTDFEFRSDSYAEYYEYLTNYEIQFTNKSVGEIREFGWNFGDGNRSSAKDPVHKYQKPGKYVVTLTIKDLEGCTASFQKEILISDYFLAIPNVFTPNGDGLNDYFFPKFMHINSMEVWILNKWGEYIFHSNKLDDIGWDGRLGDKNAPQGNYIYKIKFTTRDGRVLERTGPIFLAR